MYYDVVASNKPLLRFTALAISNDGVTFRKPNLGAAFFNGSSANNIVWPRSDGQKGHPAYDYHEPGTVFLDDKPGVPASERFKMVCSWKGGVWLLSSPDGISFTPMFGKPVVPGSDTQNVAFYDHLTERYVGYIRIDNPVPKEHPSNESCPIQAPIRRIGRCDLGTKLTPPWPCTLTDAEDVFTFDEEDPVCMDICTPSFPRSYQYRTRHHSVLQFECYTSTRLTLSLTWCRHKRCDSILWSLPVFPFGLHAYAVCHRHWQRWDSRGTPCRLPRRTYCQICRCSQRS